MIVIRIFIFYQATEYAFGFTCVARLYVRINVGHCATGFICHHLFFARTALAKAISIFFINPRLKLWVNKTFYVLALAKACVAVTSHVPYCSERTRVRRKRRCNEKLLLPGSQKIALINLKIIDCRRILTD